MQMPVTRTRVNTRPRARLTLPVSPARVWLAGQESRARNVSRGACASNSIQFCNKILQHRVHDQGVFTLGVTHGRFLG